MALRRLGLVACVFCLGSLAVLCTVARSEEKAAEPKKAEEAWYDVMRGNSVIARSHDRSEQIEYKGQPALHVIEEITLADEMGDKSFNQTVCSETWSTLDGRLLKLVYTENMKTGKSTVTAEIAGAKLTAVKTTDGKTETKEIDIPEGTIVYGSTGEWVIRLMGFNKGEKREFTVFSPSTMLLESESVTTVGVRKYMYGGQEIDAYVYQEVDSDNPGVTVELTMSQDFKLLQASGAGVKIVRIVKPAAAEPATK